ncbi:MAG: hypothetical protein QME94_19205, partial [Anaerolineae bacterium]|nr:hypothetical protein [Anaerolineae bacterium]
MWFLRAWPTSRLQTSEASEEALTIKTTASDCSIGVVHDQPPGRGRSGRRATARAVLTKTWTGAPIASGLAVHGDGSLE